MFTSLYTFLQFGYYTLVKIGVKDKKLDPLDIILFLTLFIMIASLLLVLCKGESLYVEKKDRCILLSRNFFGLAGFIMINFGVTMVPLSV